jgi:hypothetical protein
MTSKTDTFSKGDLVLLWDHVYDRADKDIDWDGYRMMPPKKMKFHGKMGIVLSRNDVFDDIYESQTYWVWVEDKKQEIHRNYMRKVNK